MYVDALLGLYTSADDWYLYRDNESTMSLDLNAVDYQVEDDQTHADEVDGKYNPISDIQIKTGKC